MLMLALIRQLPAYMRDVAAGIWQQSHMFCHHGAPIRDLSGKTLAIWGRGNIGSRLAQMAQAFGVRVIWGEHKDAAAVREGYTAFDEALSQADIVSLHCPLNEQTRNMIGAGFDVLTAEPPREGNPLLARLPNLIVTPHTAWASEEALNTMTRMIEDNIRAFVSGAPTNVIAS